MKNILDCFDKLLYGNKAANLAMIARSGLVIPRGFVIPSNHIKTKYKERKFIDLTDQELLDIVPESPIKGRAIIRSSSLIEDGAIHSAAGLYYSAKCDSNTYASEVTNVWRSPYSVSAIEFKRKNNMPIEEDIAVIVMDYIDSEYGGVLFTRHPSFERMVVEISKDGSEGITSGSLLSYHYQLPREIGKMHFLEQLYLDSLQLEKLFGEPQDIEFVVSRGKIIYLQSRPVVFKKHKLRKD